MMKKEDAGRKNNEPMAVGSSGGCQTKTGGRIRLGRNKKDIYLQNYTLRKQITKNLVVRGASSLRVNLNWSKEQGLAKEHGCHGRRGTPGSSPQNESLLDDTTRQWTFLTRSRSLGTVCFCASGSSTMFGKPA